MAVEGINRELFEKWVAALEEGRPQAFGGLEVEVDGQVTGQCCKGVLCEVAGPELAGPREVSQVYVEVTYGGQGEAPREEVMLALFNGNRELKETHVKSGQNLILLDADDPENPYALAEDGLYDPIPPFGAIDANDDAGWPFEKIAAAIRARYLD